MGSKSKLSFSFSFSFKTLMSFECVSAENYNGVDMKFFLLSFFLLCVKLGTHSLKADPFGHSGYFFAL